MIATGLCRTPTVNALPRILTSYAITHWGRQMQQPRTQRLVDWSVQGPIIGRAIFYVLGYNIMLLVVLAVVSGVQSSMAVLNDHVPARHHASFREQAVPVLIGMTLMLPFMLFDLLRLTHRIAGPLLRFESIMKEFERDGVLRLAQLREADMLIRFQQRFNRFVQEVHQRYPETASATTRPEIDGSARRPECSRSL